MAMIKIETQKTGIPIEIGELNFVFELTDENIDRFKKVDTSVSKELDALDEEKDSYTQEGKIVLKKAYDTLLGNGAFEKIYEVTPSVFILMKYLIQLVDGLYTEIEAVTGGVDAKANKYLNKAKK